MLFIRKYRRILYTVDSKKNRSLVNKWLDDIIFKQLITELALLSNWTKLSIERVYMAVIFRM